MKRKALVAYLMAGIMLSSSFLVLSSIVERPAVTVVSSPLIVPGNIGNGTGYMHYTLYVPSSPFLSGAIKQELRNSGIDPMVGGNLWTFSVPDVYTSGVNALLSNISTEFHANFSSSPNMSLAYPAVQPYTGPQANDIPFAYTPALIKRAYNFTWALNNGINGKGQTIVIVDAYGDPNLAYDIKAFDAVNGIPPVNLTVEYPFGTPGEYNATWVMETATDVEWAHALAPYANIVLLISTSAYTSYLQQLVSYAIQNRLGDIISLSWGTPENQLNTNAVNEYASVYRSAASDGIDVFAASGDGGAYYGTSGLTVSYPSSDPSVTGVGGTSLYVLNNVFHQYGWGGLNNGQSFGSGGGYSSYFNTPYWQNAEGYNGTMRGVPDVAMDADKYTGVYVISNGGQYTVGGTSVSTPMWADVAALLREYTNYSLPSINPLLYQIARSPLYSQAFTQILTGTNGYYNNTPGWNPVTGLGTPEVSGLLNASKELLQGYGGSAIFNGLQNYNATSIRTSLNLDIRQGNLDLNGSTFYYIGFQSGNYSSVKFGVLVNSTGENLMLQIEQQNISVYRYFNMPGSYAGNLSDFSMEVSYTGSSIDVNTTGGFHQSIPAFLDYSGTMTPSAGTEQIDSETNMTMINPASFANIQTGIDGTWTNVTQMFYEPYSQFYSPSFSTIGASYAGGSLYFNSTAHMVSGYINGTGSKSGEIAYSLSYGYPFKVNFSIPGTTYSVTWTVNGTSLKGSSIFEVPVSGGIFDVNGTFTDENGAIIHTHRTIEIPGVLQTNLTLNYSLPGYSGSSASTVTTMWFYNSAYSGPSRVTLLNSTSEIQVRSKGFSPLSVQVNPSANVSLALSPQKVNVTVFVFNYNSTVKIGDQGIVGHNGYFYDNVFPTDSLAVNVSAGGFLNSSSTYSIMPGQNFTDQVSLEPVNLNDSVISGTVSDYLYSFSIDNAVVRLGNTSSYTNSTGNYILFVGLGKYEVNASAPLYDSYSSPLNVTSNDLVNIQLKPSKIAIQTKTPVNITHYFPLLFYFGFISWNDYKGANFSLYQIYVSKEADFLNPTVTTISSQNTSYSFLTGLVPGHTYYISIVLRLTNSEVYQSQVVKITYSDPVYLSINIILAGGIAFYAYMAYRVFRKKS